MNLVVYPGKSAFVREAGGVVDSSRRGSEVVAVLPAWVGAVIQVSENDGDSVGGG